MVETAAVPSDENHEIRVSPAKPPAPLNTWVEVATALGGITASLALQIQRG
jgi:hypothetical protein